MKTKIITSTLIAFVLSTTIFAQHRTFVNANSSEISDNLDLRAIASIFGDSKNLDDFERQLNDPKIQISNLDLNNDNQVDYLRVLESVEGNTHLIIIQSVLGRDTYQDVATIEVEKDRNNNIQVQVVGDVYMYGQNYIYEPVYIHVPIILTSFWVNNYRPYASVWNWNYYPTYYYTWNPCPIFRYRNNINVHINLNNQYNYVNYRHSQRAVAIYDNHRSNYCERLYPNRSFAQRHTNTFNRYELDRNRTFRTVGSRNEVAYTNSRNTNTRDYNRTSPVYSRENDMPRSENTMRRPQTSESRNPNYSNQENNRRENASTRTIPQNRNEPSRENSEIRSTPQRENQQSRRTAPLDNNGRNSRR